MDNNEIESIKKSIEQILEKERDEFQDTIWRDMESRTQVANYNIISLNGEILIPNYPIFPKVFNPVVAKAALFFLEHLGVKKGDFVLDAFTGCGIDAIYAAFKGARLVHAADNFKPAYENAKYAVEYFSLQDKVKAEYIDSTKSLIPCDIYDLVIANPPFRNIEPRTESDNALRDLGYKTLINFWKEIRPHLKKNGRVRSVFSDVGDIDFYEEQMRKNKFDFKIVAQTKYASSIRIHVYETRLK